MEYVLKNNKNLTSEQIESYKRLTSLGFHNYRNLVKKTIMTIPYNATVYSNIDNMKLDFYYDMLKECYVYKKDESVIFKNEDFRTICTNLHYCLNSDFKNLNSLLEYFNLIAKVSNKLNVYRFVYFNCFYFFSIPILCLILITRLPQL